MIDQITQLVKQFGADTIISNTAVPDGINENVINEASAGILDGLKKNMAEGGMDQIAGLIGGNMSMDASNPIIKNIIGSVSENLGARFGLNSNAASGIATDLIPKVLGGLINNAKDPNVKGFEVSDLVGAISGGSGGLMDAVSKIGGGLSLDQNGDGKVDLSDAAAAISDKTGGLGGALGSIFGK